MEAYLVAQYVSKVEGRYIPTDGFIASYGDGHFTQDFDQEEALRYIHNGTTLASATVCMIVDDKRRKINLLKKFDIDGYDTEQYSPSDVMQFHLNEPMRSVFFGYVPNEHVLHVIIATTQWLVPAVITPQ